MNVALRADSLNIISLCTGGGGLDLGVELAMPSARSVVLVEREAFSASHLVSAIQQGLMAPAAIWSDVTTFNGRPWRGLVDGLIGGIPCQPHSLAGKRLGEDDERDLWSDARRIIVQSGAWFVLIENVRGMVTSGGAERVWRDLRRLGFSVEAGLFTAAEIGAPHERERIFILAVADRYHQHGDWAGIKREGWWGQSSDGGSQLADAGRERDERWRGTGDVLCSASQTEGEGDQWQWRGDAADHRGNDMADASRARLEGFEPGGNARSRNKGATAERGSSSLVHAERPERGPYTERGHEPNGDHGGRYQETSRAGEPSALVGDTARIGNQRELGDETSEKRSPLAGEHIIQPDQGRGWTDHFDAGGRVGLFPPGPSDLRGWRRALERTPELEPAFRRVADGLASRLDIARVDRLRMLGNGVVSLEAAYALRTLATRLAAAGSAGAARLVRMMIALPTH